MRYVGDLLNIVRERSHNQDFTLGTATSTIEDVTEGIGNQQLLEYVNEGQTHLQAAIVNQHPVEFVTSSEISIVPNQEEYEIPDNVFINNRLISVQYSDTGLAREYYNLRQRPLRDRWSDTSTHPSWYIRRSGKLLLNPIPTTGVGKLRVEYYRELDRLALRAGSVGSVTEAGGQITALQVLTASHLPNLIKNIGDKFLCICDDEGNVKEYNVPYFFYDDATGVFSLNPHTRTGTIPLDAGDWITIGKYTTTHSDLPSNAERFLVAYGSLLMFKTDTSQDWNDEAQVVQTMKADILDSFGDVDEDIKEFPVLDGEILY